MFRLPDLIRRNVCYQPGYTRSRGLGTLIITRKWIIAWGSYGRIYA